MLLQIDEMRLKLNGLEEEVDNLGDALDIDGAINEIRELESKTAEEGFWNDIDATQKVLQKAKQLKDKVENFQN